MSNSIKTVGDLQLGDVVVTCQNHLGFSMAPYKVLIHSPAGWNNASFNRHCRTGFTRLEDVRLIGGAKFTQVYRGVIDDISVSCSHMGNASMMGVLKGHLVWNVGSVEPEIEINVKINGTTAKLHDISEESLKKLRDLSERQDRETPDDGEDFFSPEDYR